ncbi:hypothetical protein SAMN05216540_105257 [Butyrivibrio sp. M55]|nr:hypothetical protein SAMN05216540_105257 [Butyrivibrio sp. M55]
MNFDTNKGLNMSNEAIYKENIKTKMALSTGVIFPTLFIAFQRYRYSANIGSIAEGLKWWLYMTPVAIASLIIFIWITRGKIRVEQDRIVITRCFSHKTIRYENVEECYFRCSDSRLSFYLNNGKEKIIALESFDDAEKIRIALNKYLPITEV